MSGMEYGMGGLPLSPRRAARRQQRFAPGNRGRYSGSNWWHSVGFDGNSITFAPGFVQATPFPVDTDVTIAGLAARVTSAGASATGILGIFTDDGYGYLDRLLLPSVCTIDTSSTGTKAALFPNLFLPMNLYWIVLLGLTASFNVAASSHPSLGMVGPHEANATPDLQFTIQGGWTASGLTELPPSWNQQARAKSNRFLQYGVRMAA